MDSNKVVERFSKTMNEYQKKKLSYYRPIEHKEIDRTLFEALLYPELSKGIKLPAPFQIPTYVFQQKNSFTITTNSSGNCFVQINMGQFLDQSMFKTGISGNGAAGQNNLGYFNTMSSNNSNQNGTSTVGNSNVFICNDSSLTGTSEVVSDGTVMQAANIMQVNTNTFNSVRAGPISVKYEYIGRLDISSGNTTMGINYTNIEDPANIEKSVNGLYPDPTYSVLTSLEDCPFARTVPMTDSLKAIFVPQDYSLLNLRSPTDATAVLMPQRLFLLCMAGPPNQPIARITITSNWEAIPTKQYSDIITLNYNTFPSDYSGKGIYDYMISNNLIITKDDSEFGLYKFLNDN